jgi:SAM-dependent methyltransferase
MSTRYEITGCPVCGSTDALTVADADAIRSELEQLWGFHTRRLRGDTPPGRLHDRIAFSQDPPLRVACCRTCGLLYRNPRETPNELVDLYRDERPEHDALESLYANQRRAYRVQARRLTRVAGRPERGLEIGSYVGAFLGAAREEGWQFEGVDVNEVATAFAASRGLTVSTGAMEDLAGEGDYGVVAIWNCFDQLPDPGAAMRRARTLLRDGGILALRVPNGAFYARWRPRLDSPAAPVARTLLAYSNLLGFPYRHGFTVPSLDALLHRTGFRAVRVIGDTLVPLADRWTRRWAAMEERAIKTALRRLPPRHAPWLEVYARAC